MSNTQIAEIKEKWLNMLAEIIASEKYCYTDALRVGPNELSFPVLNNDQDREEIFVNISVTVPKGVRKAGKFEPYDGYREAEDYAAEIAVK